MRRGMPMKSTVHALADTIAVQIGEALSRASKDSVDTEERLRIAVAHLHAVHRSTERVLKMLESPLSVAQYRARSSNIRKATKARRKKKGGKTDTKQ